MVLLPQAQLLIQKQPPFPETLESGVERASCCCPLTVPPALHRAPCFSSLLTLFKGSSTSCRTLCPQGVISFSLGCMGRAVDLIFSQQSWSPCVLARILDGTPRPLGLPSGPGWSLPTFLLRFWPRHCLLSVDHYRFLAIAHHFCILQSYRLSWFSLKYVLTCKHHKSIFSQIACISFCSLCILPN